MDTEFKTLMDEIDRIASTTSYNGIKVLLGNPTTTTTDLEFAFTWWTPDTDLDMHVIQPDGAHAWYANQNPNGHGEIDVDDVDGSTGPLDPAIEHYNVASGAALTGTYDLWINYYGENGGIPAAPLPTVTATVTISMYRGTPYENIQSFNVNCPYNVGDEGNDPWGGTDGVPPYGEVFVGSYFWEPLSLPSAVNLQIGPDNRASDAFSHDYFESRRGTLQIALAGLDTFDNARASIDSLDKGIGNVMNYLNTIGQRELRLQHVIDDLKSSVINLSSANSRIEDADMAEEITRLTIARLLTDTNITACESSATSIHNYYSWTSASGSNTYSIYVRWRVPDNFSAWDTSNSIQAYAKRSDATNGHVNIKVYDTANALNNAGGTEIAGAANTWIQNGINISGGTWTAGSYMTIQIDVTAAATGGITDVGEISLNYFTSN